MRLYRDVPSLHEHILVNIDVISIEDFWINENGHWELMEYKIPGEYLKIKTRSVDIAINEMHEGLFLQTFVLRLFNPISLVSENSFLLQLFPVCSCLTSQNNV